MAQRYLVTFSILALSVLLGAMDTAPAHTCPSPTVSSGGHCVLQHDVTLAATLDLGSFTHLNCQGNTITPSVVGGTDITQRSQPEVAILLTGAYGVKIFNCVIDGFDFGIFALNSKVPEQECDPGILCDLQNTILGNVINARFTPISLMFVDNTHIADNVLFYNRNGGVGLTVQRDSHRNRITNNRITGNLAITGAVRVPGPSKVPTPPQTTTEVSNPVFHAGGAGILIAQVNGPEPALFNAVIENTLYQLNATYSLLPNAEFTADNLVEGNSITFLGGNQGKNDGIVLALPQRTILRNNTVTGATNGMRAGIQFMDRPFPGACSGNTSRVCFDNTDCDIPGVDIGSQGTCVNKQQKPVHWFSDDTTMENNRVYTSFENGIALAGKDNVVQGNIITGPTSTDGSGIRLLGEFSIETTTISGNTIKDVPNALFLEQSFQCQTASIFGTKTSLNSFTGYMTAVSPVGCVTSCCNTSPPSYNLASELSVGHCSLHTATACITDRDCSSGGLGTCANSQGNYWGLMCPPGPGFDPAKVNPPNSQVIDSHPFGDSALMTPC